MKVYYVTINKMRILLYYKDKDTGSSIACKEYLYRLEEKNSNVNVALVAAGQPQRRGVVTASAPQRNTTQKLPAAASTVC